MKIIILCPFSYPSACGVWTRAYEDARYLVKKGHKVHIFSSNIIKGTGRTSPEYEVYQGIYLHRFPLIISFGENAKFWNFKKDLIKLNPDLIHSHVLRHPHTHKSSILARRLRVPFVVTTHAPFVEKSLRNKKTNALVYFYDKFLAKKFFKRCSKIIAISKWELPYLKEINCPEEKIVCIPNGIPEDFFRNKPKKSNKILFFGRINPIKNIECLINAAKILKGEKVKFNIKIKGMPEQTYLNKLKQKVDSLGLKKEINFDIHKKTSPLKERLKIFNNQSIFVLPSWREAMPTVILEAMASGLTVISSKTQGGKELIQDKKTGYLFEINNEKELANRIKQALKQPINAKEEAKKYSLKNINDKLINIYKIIINGQKSL